MGDGKTGIQSNTTHISWRGQSEPRLKEQTITMAFLEISWLSHPH